jgi:predicted DNA-binding protein with PD1-like motif
MAKSIITQSSTILVSKLPYQGDLLNELKKIAVEEKITLGKVEAIGAVTEAKIGFYNQKTYEYQTIHLQESYEITSVIGNISLRDKEPMVHAHINLADEKGGVIGGHLLPGTLVFACEVMVTVLDNGILERGFDEVTKLPLWDL